MAQGGGRWTVPGPQHNDPSPPQRQARFPAKTKKAKSKSTVAGLRDSRTLRLLRNAFDAPEARCSAHDVALFVGDTYIGRI